MAGWLSGWKRRTRFYMPADYYSADLPTGLVLDDNYSFLFEHLASDANRFKIAITPPDGITEAYADIENWSTEDQVAKLYFFSSTYTVRSYAEYYFIYFDADHADNTTYISDSGGTAAQSVWPVTSYELVSHMANDPDGDVADSIKDNTPNDRDLTPEGTMVSADLVGYNYGNALDLDGVDDCLNAGTDSDYVYVPIEIDFELDTLSECTLLSLGKVSDSRFSIEIDIYDNDIAGGGSWQVRYRISRLGTTVYSVEKDITLFANIKTSIAIYRFGTTIYFYQDGAWIGNETIGTVYAPYNNTVDDMYFGSRNGESNFLDGRIAEVWLGHDIRNSGYFEAAYHSRLGDLTEFNTFCYEEILAGTLTLADPFLSTGSMSGATPILYYAIIDASAGFVSTASMTASVSEIELTVNDPRVFTFSLSAPGYAEVIFPISSFSTRIRSGDPTYLQVVIPIDDDPASTFDLDDITDRTTDGVMILRMGYMRAGAMILSEIISIVDLEDVAIAEGPIKTSVTLSGHRTETFNVKTVFLSGTSYQKTTNGALRVRCTPDLYLRPGDTAEVNDESFIVDSISWSVSMATVKIRETYEIAEAA